VVRQERLTQLAVGLALLAVALSAYALLRTSSATPAPCDCEPLRAALEQQLNERLSAGPSSSPASPAGMRELRARVEALERAAPQASTSAAAPARVRYKSFGVPAPGVRVRQDDHGSIVVENDDPELEGSTMKIEAVRPDGVRETMIILVPPAKR
jgi:hypothetical protein